MKMTYKGADGFAAARIIAAWKDRARNPQEQGVHSLILPTKKNACELSDKSGRKLSYTCGAVSDVGARDKDPGHSYLVNVTGAENIALACRETGARMIFSARIRYTSEMMYRNRTERTNSSPCRIYGKQKQEAEQRCLYCPARYRGASHELDV